MSADPVGNFGGTGLALFFHSLQNPTTISLFCSQSTAEITIVFLLTILGWQHPHHHQYALDSIIWQSISGIGIFYDYLTFGAKVNSSLLTNPESLFSNISEFSCTGLAACSPDMNC